ncbi:hypothetical protein [uncultured Corynebacterium sp.]|uniref:hypothetical protein n=1 Tax=uncultured Corynebacterium sp. TaxID=159447 RepID=UPI0025D42100|nr:hypothetical protein [uncultured Corynebacterium sp.]
MDEQTSGPVGPEDVIIAVDDPELEQEAATVIAATGRRAVRVEMPDPADSSWRRCAAILFDEAKARRWVARFGDDGGHSRHGLYLLHADETDPGAAFGLADRMGCGEPVALPACGADLVGWIGRPDASARVAGAEIGDRFDGDHVDRGFDRRIDRGVAAPGSIIALTGAVGGAGTSTSAAAVAMLASRDDETLLVDADEFSGGADLLLGAEAEPGVRWPDVRADVGRLDAAALFDAVPRARGRAASGAPAILTGPRSRADDGWTISATAVAAVLDAVVADGAIAVVDMPGAGDIADVVAPRADVLAVVVPATVRGVAAAARRAATLRRMGGDPVAVLRWPAPGGMTAEDVSFATGLDVVAELAHVRGLARELEVDGLGRSAPKLFRALAPLLDLTVPDDRARRTRGSRP